MGSGIAQLCAMADVRVNLVDRESAFVDRGVANIKTSLARFVKSGKVTEPQSSAALQRIQSMISLPKAVEGADFIIEAVPEDFQLKQEIFRSIDEAAGDDAIFATNTSQLSITAIASAVKNPERVIGMHFFNPAVMMRLVEVVCGLRTSTATLEQVLAFVSKLGKEAAVCKRDTVGFITARAAAALRLECIRIYEEGIASIEDIDRAMRLGFNHPMGPFELTDFNGLDIALANSLSLKDSYGERFNPPQSLTSRVRAGMLGRKTGKGWYDYAGAENQKK